MISLNTYIIEKLHLDKDIKVYNSELYNKVIKVLRYENKKFCETIERYIIEHPHINDFDMYTNESEYNEIHRQITDLDELFDCYTDYSYIDKLKKKFINTIFFEKGLEIMALKKDGLLIKDSKGGIFGEIIFVNKEKDINEYE